jgi:hypothetical protein
MIKEEQAIKNECTNKGYSKSPPVEANEKEQTANKSVMTPAQQLFEMARDLCSLFHTPDHEAFAIIDMGDHQETWSIKSRKTPGPQALRDAVNLLEAEAQFNSPCQSVFIRFARSQKEIYIDLANKGWEQIRITEKECSVISANESPVRFVRTPGMMTLPRPVFGEPLTELWDFLNVEHEGDRVLIVSWLIGAMRPEGPFPILILQGEQGTAKTTTARLLCNLIDPSFVTSRSLPRSERDLAISANKVWVLSFDNLSGLKASLSDAFCRISTGGGLATRTLFTDDSEKTFRLNRPLILNGISDIATRHDLADRSLIVTLPPIPEDKRRTEREILWLWMYGCMRDQGF